MKNKFWLLLVLAVTGWLLVIAFIVLDKTALLVLPDFATGLMAGGGAALGSLCLVNALFLRYYQKNEKARRAAEVEERDERNRMLRGMAAYKATLASTPIFLVEWVVLLIMDPPTPVLLLVCAAYLIHFGVYMYHVVKLQKEM